MGKPLEGIKVVEVAMWAFVPACGGFLSDLGADVIKIEPPTGDPLRGLQTGTLQSNARNIDYSWESYNRGKRSITLDLKQDAGRAVLMKLLEDADVLLTNLLPRARRAMKIDADTIRAQFPNIIYASGSGVGPNGPESEKGGYDAISFWARGGLSSTMTEEGAERPVGPPGLAFGDTLSGSMLAGGIRAAIAKRAMTGEASTVDVSLLGASMWSQQRYICQSTADGVDRFPRHSGEKPFNVLVHNYRTKDGRFLALCMLQADKYWAPFCEVAGRPDLVEDPRYVDAAARRENIDACFAEVKALFESKTLEEWIGILSQQDGQWDVVKHVGELKDDQQVQANQYLQEVDYGDGTTIPMVSIPVLFDGKALPGRRSPELGADSDAVLASLGYSEDEIIDLKVQGSRILSGEAASPPERKLPALTRETEAFWTGGKDGQLLIQRCSQCGTYQHPPLPMCSTCRTETVAPAQVSGKGRVKTYTVNHQAWLPGLTEPFAIAAIELDEQPELYVFSNILAQPDAVRSGMRVKVSFENHEDVWLPMFVPDGETPQ